MGVLNAKEPKAPHENMFAAVADPKLPAEERNLGRLEDEGFVVLAAGTETTAYSLSAPHLSQQGELLTQGLI